MVSILAELSNYTSSILCPDFSYWNFSNVVGSAMEQESEVVDYGYRFRDTSISDISIFPFTPGLP